jgi:hypothetical protein
MLSKIIQEVLFVSVKDEIENFFLLIKPVHVSMAMKEMRAVQVMKMWEIVIRKFIQFVLRILSERNKEIA